MKPLALTLAVLACISVTACSDASREADATAAPQQALALPPLSDAPTSREAMLERRLRALEAQLASAAAAKPAGAAASATGALPARPAAFDRAGPPPLDTQQQDQERLATLESSFRQEANQDNWAVTRASVLRQMLASDGPPVAVRGVECRGHTCRLELADGDVAVRQLMSQLLQRMPGQFSAVQVAHRPDGTAVLYLQS